MNSSETIKAAEAAQILGVSEWKVYDLVRRHMIPHVRIGRSVVFRRASLEQWLAQKEAASVIEQN